MSLRLEGFPDLLTEMGVVKQKKGGLNVSVSSRHYLMFYKLTTFMTVKHVCYVHICMLCVYVSVDLHGINVQLCSVGQVYVIERCVFIESQHHSHLAFCSCLSRMLSRRWGLGMKAMSPPSLTSLPIHQSLLYFWE